jgi:hypothetical protein
MVTRQAFEPVGTKVSLLWTAHIALDFMVPGQVGMGESEPRQKGLRMDSAGFCRIGLFDAHDPPEFINSLDQIPGEAQNRYKANAPVKSWNSAGTVIHFRKS